MFPCLLQEMESVKIRCNKCTLLKFSERARNGCIVISDNNRAISSTNYFRKTGGCPKWEVPRLGHIKSKIKKQLVSLHQTKVMTPVVHTHSHKGNLVTKKVFFLLICLHLHLIDYIRKQTFVGKGFLHSFIHFFELFKKFSTSDMYLEK